jgi:hypothetical protein
MKGKIVDMVKAMNGRYRVTLELNNDRQTDNFVEKHYDYLKDKDVKVTIEKWRNRRSDSASAYFHILLGRLAAELNDNEDDVKRRLILSYGARAKDKDGKAVGFKIPASVVASTYYPYVKCFDSREENGVEFNCYIAYKQTSLMDTKEMYRLLEGLIAECKELGIETDTPEQIAKHKSYWESREKESN